MLNFRLRRIIAGRASATSASIPSGNCGTPVGGGEVPVPMTIGVLAVASAVTGMSPHTVFGDVKIVETVTQAVPLQYSITVLGVTSGDVKHTFAVPAVKVRIDRS
jgi:hypothetical protein